MTLSSTTPSSPMTGIDRIVASGQPCRTSPAMNVACPWSSPTGSAGAGAEIGGSTGSVGERARAGRP